MRVAKLCESMKTGLKLNNRDFFMRSSIVVPVWHDKIYAIGTGLA